MCQSYLGSRVCCIIGLQGQIKSCQNNKTESEIKIQKIQKICQIAADISSITLDFESAKSLACKAKSSLVKIVNDDKKHKVNLDIFR